VISFAVLQLDFHSELTTRCQLQMLAFSCVVLQQDETFLHIKYNMLLNNRQQNKDWKIIGHNFPMLQN